MVNDRPGLRRCFADLQALRPRVIKICVAFTTTVPKPRTTATATTHFPRFLCCTTFRAYETDHLRCSRYLRATSKHIMNKTRYHSMSEDTSTCKQPRTYLCKPPCPQPNCGQHFCRQHLRSSYTKHRQEHNNWICRILRMCRTLDTSSY